MDPNVLFLLLAGLACPIGMGAMMWWMNRNMSAHQGHTPDDHMPASVTERLALLYERRRLLEAEIAELEAQRNALLSDESLIADEYELASREVR